MKLQIFSVRDAKAEAFMRPFFAPNRGVGVRLFSDAINQNPEEPFARHPEDYTLFHVGEFDELTGAVTALQQPYSLGLASTFKQAV